MNMWAAAVEEFFKIYKIENVLPIHSPGED